MLSKILALGTYLSPQIIMPPENPGEDNSDILIEDDVGWIIHVGPQVGN